MGAMQVFVGYTTADMRLAGTLIRQLRAAGADVWDGHAPLHLTKLDARTNKELRWRPVSIIILSPDSLKSVHLAAATRLVVDAQRNDPGRIFLPVLATPCDPESFWLPLADLPVIADLHGMPLPHAQAVAAVLHALRLDNTLPDPSAPLEDLLRSGLALALQGNYAASLVTLQRAGERAPDSSMPPLIMAATIWMDQRYANALTICDAVLARSPAEPNALSIRGAALAKLGRLAEAVQTLQSALALDPLRLQTLLQLANVQRALRNYDAVLALTTHMAAIDPDFFGIPVSRGVALFLQGHTAASLLDLHRACELDPDNPDLQNMLTAADQGIGIAQGSTQAARLRAQVLARLGDYPPALATKTLIQHRRARFIWMLVPLLALLIGSFALILLAFPNILGH